MRGYPLFLNVKGVSCRVFGGGEVAERKVKTLLDRGAHVICVSRDFSEPLKQWARRGRLRLEKMRGGRVALNGARLVVVATSDRGFNARVAALCRRKKIFVNVADDPELCDFYAPAIVEKGPLQIAISTGGASPLFARRLREALEKVIPGSVGRVLEKAGRLRQKRMRFKK
ncbi:MAG: bifunctional precorrin-2 dehydrogenase/sirohydrochlorin ferrochelatase [Candidatus Omnitrophica bacterium]|nr:bifunctional precorrin-2 dehydrogenase/sirohydrochlorin ferrochelatase [Candidatus Omnitrophota bacterium]